MTVVKSTGYTPEDSVLSSAPTRLFSTVYKPIYKGSNAFYLCGHQAHIKYTDTHSGKAFVHVIN